MYLLTPANNNVLSTRRKSTTSKFQPHLAPRIRQIREICSGCGRIAARFENIVIRRGHSLAFEYYGLL